MISACKYNVCVHHSYICMVSDDKHFLVFVWSLQVFSSGPRFLSYRIFVGRGGGSMWAERVGVDVPPPTQSVEAMAYLKVLSTLLPLQLVFHVCVCMSANIHVVQNAATQSESIPNYPESKVSGALIYHFFGV